MSALNLRRGGIALVVFLSLSALIAALTIPPWPYATPLAAGLSVLVGHAIDEYLGNTGHNHD